MDLVSIPANPVPEDVVAGTLKTRDGVNLRFARWHPPPGRKGTVCLFQGRAEFIEKYFETVRELRSRGFAVATLDWRGQGLSDRAARRSAQGPRRRLLRIRARPRRVHERGRAAGLPAAASSPSRHSMGGSVMMNVARKGSRWFDRIVLSAPMIELAGMLGLDAVQSVDARLMRLRRHGHVLHSAAAATPWWRAGPTSATCSPPIRCATPAPRRCWRRSRRWASARRPSAGPTPPIAPCASFADSNFASKIRQPLMLIAAGRDDDRLDRRDRGLRGAAARRLASHRRRQPARADDGAGPLPRAVLGGVRRLRAGHAVVSNSGLRS